MRCGSNEAWDASCPPGEPNVMLQTHACCLHIIPTASTNASDPIIIATILPVESFLCSFSAEVMLWLALPPPSKMDDGSDTASEGKRVEIEPAGCGDSVRVPVLLLVVLLVVRVPMLVLLRFAPRHVLHITGHNARMLLPTTVSAAQNGCRLLQPASSTHAIGSDAALTRVVVAAAAFVVDEAVLAVADVTAVTVVAVEVRVVEVRDVEVRVVDVRVVELTVVMVVAVVEVCVNVVVDTVVVVVGQPPSPGVQSIGPPHCLPPFLAAIATR